MSCRRIEEIEETIAVLTLWGAKHRFCDRNHRRDFLRAGTLGLGGLTLADILHRPAASNLPSPRAVIRVCLAEGRTHRDRYVMKPGARRP